MHEEEDHQQHFAESDDEGHNRVKWAEVDESHPRGQQSQTYQAGKNENIRLQRHDLLGHQ
jgi:hypothetical protein